PPSFPSLHPPPPSQGPPGPKERPPPAPLRSDQSEVEFPRPAPRDAAGGCPACKREGCVTPRPEAADRPGAPRRSARAPPGPRPPAHPPVSRFQWVSKTNPRTGRQPAASCPLQKEVETPQKLEDPPLQKEQEPKPLPLGQKEASQRRGGGAPELNQKHNEETLPPFLIHGWPARQQAGGSSSSSPARCPQGAPAGGWSSRLDGFPPGRPTQANLERICLPARQRVTYGPWNPAPDRLLPPEPPGPGPQPAGDRLRRLLPPPTPGSPAWIAPRLVVSGHGGRAGRGAGAGGGRGGLTLLPLPPLARVPARSPHGSGPRPWASFCEAEFSHQDQTSSLLPGARPSRLACFEARAPRPDYRPRPPCPRPDAPAARGPRPFPRGADPRQRGEHLPPPAASARRSPSRARSRESPGSWGRCGGRRGPWEAGGRVQALLRAAARERHLRPPRRKCPRPPAAASDLLTPPDPPGIVPGRLGPLTSIQPALAPAGRRAL
uniref:Uncharacterized protein n=1 Tax=Ornithorhynchus anatinus TaxID=9258 RepID=A0A6I8P2Y8_ORNAN